MLAAYNVYMNNAKIVRDMLTHLYFYHLQKNNKVQ